MQSKFWAAGSESEDSGVSSGSEDGGQAETQVAQEVQRKAPAAVNRWAAVETSSSDEEGGRVVKSLKDRRWAAMREVIRQMRNHMKICDFSELYKDYESLIRCLQKAQQVVEVEGVPNFFVRILVELEGYLEEKHRDKEAFKKLSKAKATAFNTVRAKVRKTNEQWQEKVELCRANPEQFETSDSEDGGDSDDSSDMSDDDRYSESSSESEEEEEVKQRRSSARRHKKEGGEGEGSSEGEHSSEEGSEWSDSEESSMSSGDDTDKHKAAMAKWGLRAEGDESKRRKTPKVSSSSKKKVTFHRKRAGREEGTGDAAGGAEYSAKDMESLFDTTNLDVDVIRKRVQMVVERRGRRGVDRVKQTRILQRLAELAATVGAQCELEILGHLISAEFDTTMGVFACLTSRTWLTAYSQLERVLELLEQNPEAHLIPTALATSEGVEAAVDSSDAEAVSAGILTSFVERLDDELMKSLQFTDVHSEEYKERLGQSIDMMATLCRAWVFLTNRKCKPYAATLALRINEHMHCKHDTIATRMWELIRRRLPEEVASQLPDETVKPSDFTEKLTNIVFESENSRERTRALLHMAYNKALHDDYYKARDLLLTPNVQELAVQTDVQTQILYNRNLVQLGLCAFRNGLIPEAHSCLSEICPKHKELLAQGLSNLKNVERTLEQERAEKRRLLPYHMHISMELIEGAHNISAMLIEVPQMAHDPYEYRKRPTSKHFRRMLEMYERQAFSGPPENARETVMAATKALQRGDWQECCRHVFSLGIWDKLLNTKQVQEMFEKKIKQEAMRTYIFTYLSLYDSFSIAQLCSMFALPQNVVHSIISKMMINEEIHASWDESSHYILISRVERTRLQQLCYSLAENVNAAVEQNELTLNMKNPKFALAHDRRYQGRGEGGPGGADRFGMRGDRDAGEGGGGGGFGARRRGFGGRGGRGGFGPGGRGRGGRGGMRGGLRPGARSNWHGEGGGLTGERGERSWGGGGGGYSYGGDRWGGDRQRY